MNNNNNNNSMNIMNANTYFKGVKDLTDRFLKHRGNMFKDNWNNFSFFQKLIIIGVFLILPLILLIIYLLKKSNIKINRNLNADYSLLDINNELQFIGIVNNGDENYKNLLNLFLKKYYPDMISNNELNYNINHNKLKNEVDGTYTYSIWMYINGDESGVYNYFKSKLLSDKDVTTTTMADYNWSILDIIISRMYF